jgi:glycosyltransferase involved in cell wall biosynthesis
VLPQQGALAERLAGAGVDVVIEPLAVLRRRLLSASGAARLAREARRERESLAELARDAALVHSNTSVILGGGRAARGAGIPHVVHVREIYEGAATGFAARAWPLLRRRLEAADARVCVSRAVAEQFREAGTHVVHDAPTRKTSQRPSYGGDSGTFTVAVLGRIADWKGQDVLARALAEPALAEIGAVGLIAGDAYPGEEARAPDLGRLRDELGLGERLRLLGFRADPEVVLDAADVVVVPSTRPDPFPNSALEALAAGRPVVASNAGGLPEMIDDEESGLLVAPGDPAALAAALRALADDPGRRERMGIAGARAAKRFSLDAMLDGIEAVYAQLGVTR